MKIRTPAQLDEELEKELEWRQAELRAISSLIREIFEKPSRIDTQRRAMIHSGIVLLYAHWEGFVKNAATLYLNFVATEGKDCRDLTINFRVIQLKDTLENTSGMSKSLCNLLQSLDKVSDNKFSKYENAINTGSNLSFERFKEITCILNIDYSLYESSAMILNERLLKSRNTIAHGQHQWLTSDLEDYRELDETIRNFMETFRNQLSNLAITKSYLINP